MVVFVLQCVHVCALGGWGQSAGVFFSPPSLAKTRRSPFLTGVCSPLGAGVQALRGGGDAEVVRPVFSFR